MLWGEEALRRGSFSSQSLSYHFSLSLLIFFWTIILIVETSKFLKGVLNQPADGILPLFRAMGQTQGSCQVDWVEKLMEPCLPDIPSKAQMFQRMCAPTSEWIPRLHNHSVCKVMVSGMGTCDSGRYRWCICRKWALCLPGWMLLQHGLVQWLSTGIFVHVERTIKLIQGLFNRTRWTILHEKGLQKSQDKTHKSQVNDSLQACGWWNIQRGPDKVTAQCPQSSSVLREASSL